MRDRCIGGSESAKTLLRQILGTKRRSSPTPTECSPTLFEFAPVVGHAVVAGFDGRAITSNAGALLLGAPDRAVCLVRRFAHAEAVQRIDAFVRRRPSDVGAIELPASAESANVATCVVDRNLHLRPRFRGGDDPAQAAVRTDDYLFSFHNKEKRKSPEQQQWPNAKRDGFCFEKSLQRRRVGEHELQ